MTLAEYMKSLHGKKIGVIGIGVSNTPLLEALLDSGNDVTACDRRSREALEGLAEQLEAKGAKLRLGADYLQDLDCDLVFRTPGIHPENPEFRAAVGSATVTSEMEVFFSLCPCRTIAVTGSDGKTTTTSIIAELLRTEGYTVHLGGNIGKPLLTEIPKMRPEDFAVLELSSFQLHSMTCSPDVAVITNISPNHLDVHPDYADYIAAKEQIFCNQRPDACLVLNQDNSITREFAGKARGRVRFFSRRETMQNGVFSKDGTLYASRDFYVEAILPETEILLPGKHNVENYCAAFAATLDYVSADVYRKVARNYKGVAHRLERIRVRDGVTYINDSIASSPTRTIAGLRALEKKPILIAGGYDKQIPFEELGDEICQRVKALFLTGFTAEKIKRAVEQSIYYDPVRLPIVVLDDFKETILAASAMAQDGDTVLLSPACSSFDKFRNFAHRGDTFREIVNAL